MVQKNVSALIVAKPSRIRDGIRALLRSVSYIKVIGQVDDASGAMKMVTDYHPTLVLLGSNLPNDEIQAVLKQTKAQQPQTGCIVLANTAQQQGIAKAAGADSVLFAGLSATKFFASIDKILNQQGTQVV